MTEKLGSGVRVVKKGASAGATVGGATAIAVGITEFLGPMYGLIATAIVTGFVWLKNGGALDIRKILFDIGLPINPTPKRRSSD